MIVCLYPLISRILIISKLFKKKSIKIQRNMIKTLTKLKKDRITHTNLHLLIYKLNTDGYLRNNYNLHSINFFPGTCKRDHNLN